MRYGSCSTSPRGPKKSVASKRKSLRGAFITFEGVDGCGKTTQAGALAARLRQTGLEVVETREPGGTTLGQGLREVLLNPANAAMVPECELLLFLADRVQHLGEVIAPALARGATVISDRFHDSTVAYQQYGRELDFSPVASVIEQKIEPHAPDLTLWLDADLGEAQARIGQRQLTAMLEVGRRVAARLPPEPLSEDTRLENEALNFHMRVQQGYGKLLERYPARIVRVDGARPIEEISAEVWKVVEARFDVL